MNHQENISAWFEKKGVTITTGADESGEQAVHLSLLQYGNQNRTANGTLDAMMLTAGNDRVVYNYGPFSEWYVNDERGIEHGVTIVHKPELPDNESCKIAWQVSGLSPRLSDDQTKIEFLNPSGATVLQYGTIVAWDAAGRSLPAWLQVEHPGDSPPILSWMVDLQNAEYPVTIDPLFTQAKKLIDPNGLKNDYLGTAVAISGDIIAVGANGDDNPANTGTVFIFYRDQGGANNWGLVRAIAPTNGNPGDYFGSSLALSGNTLVVGAMLDSTNGPQTGAAYIFTKDAGGSDNWGQVKKLFANDAAQDDVTFAARVAISGDIAVIASYYDDDSGNNSGSAYVFQKDEGGVDNWGQVKKLLASDGSTSDYFGWGVAVSGDTIAVGAKGDNGASPYSYGARGSLYIFQRDFGGMNAWGEVKKLLASDGADFDAFGNSVTLDGDILVTSAPGNDDAGEGTGSAYVFYRNLGGQNNWGEMKKLTASDGVAGDSFGAVVALAGEKLVIGVPGDDDPLGEDNTGSLYLFLKDHGGLNNWGEAEIIRDPEQSPANPFGSSLDINGSTIVAGSHKSDGVYDDTGAAYVFADASPKVSLSLASSSFDENGGTVHVMATTSNTVAENITVHLAFSGTATTADYSYSHNSIVIPAGNLSSDITLTGLDDSIFDPEETVLIEIESVANASENGFQQVEAVINDDELPPTVSLALSHNSLAESRGTTTLTATLSAITEVDVTVELGYTGSASSGDYITPLQQLLIPAGSIDAALVLTGVDDNLYDPDETVVVAITDVTNGLEDGVQEVTATIVDDELRPTVSLSLAGSPLMKQAVLPLLLLSFPGRLRQTSQYSSPFQALLQPLTTRRLLQK